jgi:hypothetical protein
MTNAELLAIETSSDVEGMIAFQSAKLAKLQNTVGVHGDIPILLAQIGRLKFKLGQTR